MKKILFIFILTFMVILPVSAKQKVTVYIFTKGDETISSSAIDFFKELKKTDYGEYFDYKNIEVWDANWKEDAYNRKIADKVAVHFNDTILGAPYIVIGSDYKLATFTDDYTDELKETIVKAYDNDKYQDVVEKVIKDIKLKQEKDIISFIVISTVVIAGLAIFIILARKNNDSN